MTYKELEQMTEGTHLPLAGENEHGEVVIIEEGKVDEERVFRVTTAQHNGWVRINYFYKDGSVEEMFDK